MLHPRFLPLPFTATKNRLPKGKRFLFFILQARNVFVREIRSKYSMAPVLGFAEHVTSSKCDRSRQMMAN